MWLFGRKRRAETHVTTNAEVMRALADMSVRVSVLEEEVKANHLHHLKLRGRVYAALGKAEPERDPDDLTDPKLTKEQIRARLHGRRFQHST